jgi:NodT family efflux transporter outer membrane factor (OMF) lipoprotein
MLRLSLVTIAAVLLAGCMVGPKYTKPAVPMTPAYKEPPPESFKEWKTAQPGDQTLRGNWWEIFGDPRLNSLEEQVAASNQSLKEAEARFAQARALIRFNRAAKYPTISTAPSIDSLHQSGNRPFSTKSGTSADFVLPFDISYEVDLWGRVRRTVNAATNEAQAVAADLQNTTLMLQSELAFDYFELRSADAQKQLLDGTAKAYADALQLTVNRFEGGAAPKSDVAQAQTQLETTRVQATDIDVQRAQFEHAIATLIGKPPAQFTLARSPLKLQPPNIPVGVPSELLERRPDIAAFERRVAEANEQIGIARAAFFPTLLLGGTGGFESSSITGWFNWPSRFWAIGPAALQTLFDGGRRRATSEGAIANYDATVAGYRETTLTAFQEVEDNLAALRILEQEAQQQTAAVDSAQESLQLFMNRYTGGVDSYLQVITAQTVALTNERNDVDILRRRLDASVLLIKAVGGGWNVSKLPQVSQLR